MNQHPRCPHCHVRARILRAERLVLGEHRSTDDGNLQVDARVLDICSNCNAERGSAEHLIAIPLDHHCRVGQAAVWDKPTIYKQGLRPDVGWALTVIARCQHCGGEESTIYRWILEEAPPDE